MVRRAVILFVSVMMLALLLAMPVSASAYSAYNEGNISTTYITIYRDISVKVSPFDDYVFSRTGQYEYIMAVGDLTLSNNSFRSNGSVEVYRITTGQNNYNSTYQYSITTESSFSLSAGNELVYSNLGSYPDLIERTAFYEISALLLMLVALCMYLIRSIFGFCLRSRR